MVQRSLFYRYAWPACATLLALVATLMVCAAYDRVEGGITSDDLRQVAILDDLLAGNDMAGWHQPGAPYFFPDLVLLFPFRLVFSDVAHLFAAYTITFYAIIIVALAWLAHELGLDWRVGWSGGALGVALLMSMNLDSSSILLYSLARLDTHLGHVAVGLLFVAFLLRSLRHGFSRWISVLWVILGGLTVFSDRLFVLQFLIPIALTLALLRLRGHITTRQVIASAAIVGPMLLLAPAIKALFVTTGQRFLVVQQLFSIPSPIDLWRNGLFAFNYCKSEPVQFLAAVVCLMVCTAALRVHWHRLVDDRSSVQVVAFCMIVLLACASGLVPPFLMDDPGFFVKYSLLLLFFPPLLLALVSRIALVRWAGAIQVAILVFVGWQLTVEFQRFGWPSICQPYPELAQVLDRLAREHNCRRGVAGFWNARRLKYLTHEHVDVLPAWRDGRPYVYGHNPNDWLASDRHSLEAPDYQFIVVGPDGDWPDRDWPTAEPIRREFGEPIRRVAAGDHEVWIYDRLVSGRFQIFLNSLLARRYERGSPTASSPENLGQPKDGYQQGRPSDSALVLERGAEAELRFPCPATGRLLDFSGECDATYEVAFLCDGKEVGTVHVPRVDWFGSHKHFGPPGLRSRLLPLPATVCEHEWDRVIVRNPSTKRSAAIGHVLVFTDGPNLAALAVPVPAERRRFEAEEMRTEIIHGGRRDAQQSGSLDDLRCQRVWILHKCADNTLEPDAAASGGWVRHATVTEQGLLVYGPFLQLHPGSYRVDFALKADAPQTTNVIANIEVTADPTGRHPMARRRLCGRDFPRPDQWRVLSVPVEVPDSVDGVEFRVYCQGGGAVWVDYVELVPLDNDGAGPGGTELQRSHGRAEDTRQVPAAAN